MPDTTNPQPDRYRQRPNEVDAIQWTGSNADALRAFAGIDFDTIAPADRIDDPDCDAQLLVEASHWVGIRPGDWVLKFEGYFVAKDDAPFRAVWEPAADAVPLAADIPARLEAVLTERFTELGNPFSRMRLQESGPDGWPTTWEVSPRRVADVLRELLAAAPVPPSAPTDRAAIYREVADRLAAGAEQGAQDGWMRIYKRGAVTKVREWADELAVEAPAPSRAGGEGRQAAGEVVAYRDPNSPKTLLCRYHGERWQGVVPVTAEELPDGGICTFGRLSSLECGRDVLIPQPAKEA
ncbi:hypothetical protein [Streptomyces mirabilis]|uniref:hypothetical protein n=1 Tax=Streptomyces mirabilis TaxID=68239 RepID=UPI00367F920F